VAAASKLRSIELRPLFQLSCGCRLRSLRKMPSDGVYGTEANKHILCPTNDTAVEKNCNTIKFSGISMVRL